MAKDPEFEIGDVVKNKWDEYRIIYLVHDGYYHYANFQVGRGFFFNPTHAANKFDFMQQTYKKVGVISNLDAFRDDIFKIVQMHNQAFSLASDLLSRHTILMLRPEYEEVIGSAGDDKPLHYHHEQTDFVDHYQPHVMCMIGAMC